MEEGAVIETMTAEEATQYLRRLGMSISKGVLIRGIQNQKFPFGDYIPPEKQGESPRTYVYTVLLEDWIAQRTRKVVM